MFREVSIVEVREVLRLWLRGHSQRSAAKGAGLDRKTGDRYINAAKAVGVTADGGEEQLTDEAVGAILARLRAGRPRGDTWATLETEREFLKEKLEEDLTLVKIHVLLRRRGVLVPYRTLHRFCVQEFDFGRQRTTVRVVDGEPGHELQMDFGRMGMVKDILQGRRRTAWCLVLTAVVSRHMFCWLTFSQTTAAVIEGLEQAWIYFGGMFRVLIPDNLSPVVDRADPLLPRFNQTFLDYVQARGIEVDPARVRRPMDKPRVERAVPYVRESGFKGEKFVGHEQAREWMVRWSHEDAGNRIHGTTQRRPIEHFEAVERGHLLPLPDMAYDIPRFAEVKVGRDFHISIANAFYSVPHAYVREQVSVRVDSGLVKIFHRGQLIKTHLRQPPGGHATDAADYPPEKAIYATRDLDYLRRVALGQGPSVGAYVARILDGPLPWNRMRLVFKLNGLVRRYGAQRVDQACYTALELDVVDVFRIARMLERGLENGGVDRPAGEQRVIPLRFTRPDSEFELNREARP